MVLNLRGVQLQVIDGPEGICSLDLSQAATPKFLKLFASVGL
jgi:hypothetical protein